MDIVEFLHARLDEDEQIIIDAGGGDSWYPVDFEESPDGKTSYYTVESDESIIVSALELDLAKHIARFDPARMSKEVKVKRILLDQYEKRAATPEEGSREAVVGTLSVVIEALAAAYADHPDYRQEWPR